MTEFKRFTDEVMKDMGKRIQIERKKKGFKAIDFADIIGIGKDQLSRIENGKVPCKMEYLFVIAQILENSVDYIVFGTKDDKNSEELICLLAKMSAIQKDKLSKVIKILAED